MEIYFIRHGQTDGNVAKRHQANTTRLTDLGRQQAEAAAQRVKEIKPDFFISSSMVRAIETSSIIAQATDMIPSTGALFAELERPAKMYGFHHKDPRSLWFYIRWYFGLVNVEGTGAESYKMFRERIAMAQEALMKYPMDAKLVVVSHSVFI
nr:histidine phosphatase family protein [Candidatus Paceibacterota bacterium]